MSPVPTVYPQKLLRFCYQHCKLLAVFPEKRSFPGEIRIRTFQDLNKSIASAGFQFKELHNCVLHFHLVFEYETKFLKILESIKFDGDLHVQLQYNGIPFPLRG